MTLYNRMVLLLRFLDYARRVVLIIEVAASARLLGIIDSS